MVTSSIVKRWASIVAYGAFIRLAKGLERGKDASDLLNVMAEIATGLFVDIDTAIAARFRYQVSKPFPIPCLVRTRIFLNESPRRPY